MPILGIIASQISGHLTPPDTGAMFPLGMVSVGSAGAASVTFSSIPSTYTHLQVRIIDRDTSAFNDSYGMYLKINSDTGSNYSTHYLLGTGATVLAGGSASQTPIVIAQTAGGGMLSNTFGVAILDFIDYKNTSKYKTIKSLSGYSTNSTVTNTTLTSGLWMNTNAITTITLTPGAGNWAQYSSFALYGIL